MSSHHPATSSPERAQNSTHTWRTHTWRTDDAGSTHALGLAIGRALATGLVIALRGDLGAGKTTLTQGIARGLGITEPIASPTFTFVNEYSFQLAGSQPARLYHIDLYRLPESPSAALAEAATFGLDDILDAAESDAHTRGWSTARHEVSIVIIEWAERIANALPPTDCLVIDLAAPTSDETTTPDTRVITVQATGTVASALLQRVIDTTTAA